MGLLQENLDLREGFYSKGHEGALLAALEESLQNGNAQRAVLAQMFGETAWQLTDEELLAFMQEAEDEYYISVFESSYFDPSIGMFTTGTAVDTIVADPTEELDVPAYMADFETITTPQKDELIRSIGTFGTTNMLGTRTDAK